MKKLIIVLVLLLAATALFAQIRIQGFPAAKFLDSAKGGDFDYEAVWEFSANSIRILDTAGNVQWDFSGKTVKDFKVSATESGDARITFSCPEAERSYIFTTNMPTKDITMVIKRDGLPDYIKRMSPQ
jgi:hypothetical protein